MGIVVLGLGFWGKREMASMEQKFSSPFYFFDLPRICLISYILNTHIDRWVNLV